MRELRGPSTLREMAEPIGIKYSAWARYEAGDSIPGGEIITKICRVHACSADWLLGLKDSATPLVSVRGNANTIAAGTGARAVSSSAADCKSCPYKKWGEKLRKQGLVIPGA